MSGHTPFRDLQHKSTPEQMEAARKEIEELLRIPRESIEAVLDYNEEDESEDYEVEFGDFPDDPAEGEPNHIYTHIQRVRAWLDSIDEEKEG